MLYPQGFKGLIILLGLFLAVKVNAQMTMTGNGSNIPGIESNVILGGTFGFNLNRGNIQFEIDPTIGLSINDRIQTGIGVDLKMRSHLYTDGILYTKRNFSYGAKAYERFYITQQLFQQAEFGFQSYETIEDGEENRILAPEFNIGIGYTNGNNYRGPFVMILYNVLHDKQSRFTPSPWKILVGITF